MHCSRRRLLRRGLEFHVCSINKSAHGNLFNEASVLEVWVVRSISIFPLLPDPLWSGPVSFSSMSLIDFSKNYTCAIGSYEKKKKKKQAPLTKLLHNTYTHTHTYLLINVRIYVHMDLSRVNIVGTQFSSIWPIDRTLSGVTTMGQGEPGSNGNEGLLRIFQSSSITGTSPSDCLESYLGYSLEGFLLLCWDAVTIFYSPSRPTWACLYNCEYDYVLILVWVSVTFCVWVCFYVCMSESVYTHVNTCKFLCMSLVYPWVCLQVWLSILISKCECECLSWFVRDYMYLNLYAGV